MTFKAKARPARKSTERKPRVDPKVPTVQVNRWLGRLSVGTPDSEIVAILTAQIAKRAAGNDQWTETIKRQTIRYALWRHHRNLAEYAAVSS